MLIPRFQLLLFLPCVFVIVYGSVEDKLLTKLFESYDRDARPVVESVQVQHTFYLQKLYDVDLKEQILHSGGYSVQEWNDPRLRWNASEYAGITVVSVANKHIWKPDIALMNAIGGLSEGTHSDQVKIRSNGDVSNAPGGSYASSCNVDITYFPFDEQVCHFNFGIWTLDETKTNATVSSSKVILESYSEHAEWNIVDTFALRYGKTYSSSAGSVFAELFYIIHLKRKPLYFIFQIIVPSVFLSVLVVSLFCLPSNLGVKINVGVTVLLAFSVFMSTIAEQLPRSSETVSLIGVYLVFFMGTSTLAIVTSILVLRIYHRGTQDPPPKWLEKLMFHYNGQPWCQPEKKKSTIEEDDQTVESNDWKQVAEVMDKCFFFLFSAVFVAGATIILAVMPSCKPKIDITNWTPK